MAGVIRSVIALAIKIRRSGRKVLPKYQAMIEKAAAYEKELQTDDREAVWSHPAELRWLFKLSDMLETQKAVLSSMLAAARTFGSRGSALVLDPAGESLEGLLTDYRFVPGRTSEENLVLYTEKTRRGYRTVTEPARPIPEPDNWFENVWREFREREGI